MIINVTDSYCGKCQKIHKAYIEQQGAAIIFRTICPKEEKVSQISSDANIFLALRDKTPIDLSHKSQQKRYPLTNLVEITNACNFSCPICYSDAGLAKEEFLAVDDILNLAGIIKKTGGRSILLTGGEPTLHPDLPLAIPPGR